VRRAAIVIRDPDQAGLQQAASVFKGYPALDSQFGPALYRHQGAVLQTQQFLARHGPGLQQAKNEQHPIPHKRMFRF
jgi:hypothetical protein